MQGVCDYLHTTSFELQVKMCSSTQFQQPGFLSTSLKRQSFDGVLVLASWMLNRYDAVELRKERISFVLIGCRDADGFAPSIEANNEAIVRELVGRLAAQGHSNFALLGGEESQLHMCDRYSGFRLGLEDHGILLRKNLVLHGDWTVESGYRLMRRLLMEEPKPTAANDLLRPLPPQVEVYGWHTFEHRADFWRYQNRHCARLRGVRL